jgi:rhodanese-related sulfurtransferase
MTREIEREELREMLEKDEDFVLVDVLDEPFYRHSHLPGAINIPLDGIGGVKEAIPDKDTPVVVYCMDPP